MVKLELACISGLRFALCLGLGGENGSNETFRARGSQMVELGTADAAADMLSLLLCDAL